MSQSGSAAQSRREAKGFAYYTASLGPGFILAATSVGSGSIVASTNTGASFGYQLLWWFIVILAFRAIYSYAMNRFTLVTGKPIMVGIRDVYGPVWAGLAGVFAFIGQLMFGAGNFLAAGMGLNILFPALDIKVGGILSLVICIALLFLRGLYVKMETIMKLLVGVMVVIFLVALATSGGAQATTNTSVFPAIPAGSFVLMLSLLGTTASLGTCAWGSSLARDKGYTLDDLKRGGMLADVLVSVICIGVISVCIMFVGANLLPGQPIRTGLQLSGKLEALLGGFIRPVFGIGFFAAAVSSLIMAPKLGINLLFQAFNKQTNFENRQENVVSALMLVFGAIVALVYGGMPAHFVTLAQIGGVINAPILGLLTILLVASARRMGEHVAGTPLIIALGVSYIFILVTVINNLVRLAAPLFS